MKLVYWERRGEIGRDERKKRRKDGKEGKTRAKLLLIIHLKIRD